jgi:hypothetical protein
MRVLIVTAAEVRGVRRENFAFGQQLGVNFQTDDGFPITV